ncbi:P-loop containing nucleoside triphosphate hydrolase protein [Hyaloscypha finlandica]|nr:P-loop containing nucleoside triphosphate hydrolase protein [Hyaloscypha finlandica]
MASAISFADANSGLQAGTINGPVNTEFHHHHAPPERVETPPNPSVVIPFSRDTDFVERGILLDQIHQKCAVLGSRTALVGLGGVGKSQLAIEYAYRTRDRSPETWVFWVHASNAARFEQSFREIANCVKIPGRQSLQTNVFQLVHDWLRDDRKGKWVLILDNVDDTAFLVETPRTSQDGQTNSVGSGNLRPLVTYLPQCPNGSILITTRSENAALKLVERRDIIAIKPMSKPDALALLEGKLGRHNDGDDATELAAELEFMPLAIVQAAAYISQRVPRYSVREYLQDFRKSDRKRASLLNHDSEQLRRDWEAKNSIIITWQISFDHIRMIRPSATDLLSLMSFFDRQGIPEALLRNRDEYRNSQQGQKESNDDDSTDIDADIDASHSDDDEDNASQPSVSDGFEDDVLALRNYSFISINTDGTTFEMHRLVQLATRKWLEAHEQQERWKQQFIKNLDAKLPTGEYENWVRCQTLFPHAQSAAAQRPQEQDSLRDWASILYKAAWYAWRMGKGVEAEKMSIQAMEVRKKILGWEHNDTLDSIEMVGLAYKLRGQWDAAEELEVQVLETRKKRLGADHLDTLTSMANLASTYRYQGRWDTAEELQVQVLETRKKRLGADHPDTLNSMNNLVSTYLNQGRWDAAEELEVQVLETRKKRLGADHPDTLISMANLASTFWNQGRWDAAEELEVQVLETLKKSLGADHPDTLASMNNLASTYWNQGRWDTAEELEVQVLEMRKKRLGADHPGTLTSINNLAFTWKGIGRETEAIRLMEECIQSRKRVLGPDHPHTLSSCTALVAWKAEQEDVVI